MSDVLRNFELTAVHFTPGFLIAAGLATLAIGLCIWLGGLRAGKLIAAIPAAAAGALAALVIAGPKPGAVAGMAVIAAGFALLFDKAALTVAAAAFTVIAALLVFAAPALEDQLNSDRPKYQVPADDSVLDVAESLSITNAQIAYFGHSIAAAVKSQNVLAFSVAAIAGLVVAALGFLAPRIVAAVACASFGAILIFIAMISLLLYKGAAPLSRIHQKPVFYAVAIAAMIAFGTMAQLLLCPTHRKIKETEKHNRGEES
jgi:hypothetical protein